jgi:hypothetical protein
VGKCLIDAAARAAGKTDDGMVDYTGMVYCVTVPNHIVCAERRGKAYLSLNSGRYGDKGVVSQIVPDHQMPHDRAGRPFEVLTDPSGVISRGNPAQNIEAQLGKIAALTGKPYKVEDFGSIQDLEAFAEAELKKHGLTSTEHLIDPKYGNVIPNVQTGTRFFMKLHHVAESKAQARSSGNYSNDESPAKGGDTGCFVAGTQVAIMGLCGDRTIAIDDVVRRRSDIVVRTRLPHDERIIYRDVTDWFECRVHPGELLEIVLASGHTLCCTRTHVMILANGIGKMAGELVPGDDLLEVLQ